MLSRGDILYRLQPQFPIILARLLVWEDVARLSRPKLEHGRVHCFAVAQEDVREVHHTFEVFYDVQGTDVISRVP